MKRLSLLLILVLLISACSVLGGGNGLPDDGVQALNTYIRGNAFTTYSGEYSISSVQRATIRNSSRDESYCVTLTQAIPVGMGGHMRRHFKVWRIGLYWDASSPPATEREWLQQGCSNFND